MMYKYLLKSKNTAPGLRMGKEYEAVLHRGVFYFKDGLGRRRYRTKSKLAPYGESYRRLTTTPQYEVL